DDNAIMPASIRLVRSRLKSVKNTKKITKAMELVSASKMRKAVLSVLASRPYCQFAREAVFASAKKLPEGLSHAYLETRPNPASTLLIIFSSDKGLCGSFNSQLLRTAEGQYQKELAAGRRVSIVAAGKRGANYFKTKKAELLNVFTNLANNPTASDARPIAKIAVDEFLSKTYDQVKLVYTDYRSALVQKPKVVNLLPLVETADADLGRVNEEQTPEKNLDKVEYLFEPDPKKLIDALVPRLLEVLLYQALLESNASEHSARMMNMKNASDAARDMIDDLTLTMNQARQAGITREISEISAGKAALE
ncbi:MAG: ATP synthase F1 subunit gamma, partial [bacterium]